MHRARSTREEDHESRQFVVLGGPSQRGRLDEGHDVLVVEHVRDLFGQRRTRQATAFTLMPSGPSSTAIVCVRWLIAAFAAPYALMNGAGRVDSPELTFTMTPPPLIIRASAAPASAVITRF